ncbi:MAG: hypothetical protein WC501_05690 [Candidatus Micrarchaeia archaeon]
MNLKILISVLFVGLLFFGCIGGEEQKTGTNNEITTPETGETGNIGTEELGEKQTTPETDLASKTLEELQGLGLPLVCEITYKDPQISETIQSVVLYLHGNKMRMGMEVSSAGMDMSMTFIVPDDGYAYTKMHNEMLMGMLVDPGCDWLKTEIEETTTNPTQELSDSSKVEIKCVPGTFTDSMFSVVGKACSMKTSQ